jgi:hypothetical protein
MSHVTGRVFITLNGQRIQSKDGASLDMGGLKRTPVIADGGIVGYSEELTAPEVNCKVAHIATTSLKEFQDFKDGSLMFETDTGSVFSLSEAWNADPPKLEKGEITLKFNAIDCVEN